MNEGTRSMKPGLASVEVERPQLIAQHYPLGDCASSVQRHGEAPIAGKTTTLGYRTYQWCTQPIGSLRRNYQNIPCTGLFPSLNGIRHGRHRLAPNSYRASRPTGDAWSHSRSSFERSADGSHLATKSAKPYRPFRDPATKLRASSTAKVRSQSSRERPRKAAVARQAATCSSETSMLTVMPSE